MSETCVNLTKDIFTSLRVKLSKKLNLWPLILTDLTCTSNFLVVKVLSLWQFKSNRYSLFPNIAYKIRDTNTYPALLRYLQKESFSNHLS
jgi:hypothetical protein